MDRKRKKAFSVTVADDSLRARLVETIYNENYRGSKWPSDLPRLQNLTQKNLQTDTADTRMR